MSACRTCPPSLAPPRVERTRVETHSFGFDPILCGLGTGLGGNSLVTAGLRVPTLPSDFSGSNDRYLFQLCTLTLGYRERAWLVGLTQTLEIGLDTNAGGEEFTPAYPNTKVVGRWGAGNPLWSFSDANTSWHVRLVRQPPQIPWAGQNVLSTDSFAWRWSSSPALVFETATFNAANLDGNGHPDNYVALTSYTAPYGGKIPGEPVGGGLGGFTDLRFPPDDPSRQVIEPIYVEGPGALVFYATVFQTDPSTRPTLTVPAMFPIDPEMPEEGFVAAWPQSVYWRIGGSMVLERERDR